MILPPSIGASLPSADSATFKVTNGRTGRGGPAGLCHCGEPSRVTSVSFIAGERTEIRADVVVVFVLRSLEEADDPVGERGEHDLGGNLQERN